MFEFNQHAVISNFSHNKVNIYSPLDSEDDYRYKGVETSVNTINTNNSPSQDYTIKWTINIYKHFRIMLKHRPIFVTIIS